MVTLGGEGRNLLSQSEHARYIAELTEQQNFNERAQLALNAFEVNVYFFFALQRSDLTLPARTSADDPLVSGRKSAAVSRFWSEVAEEVKCSSIGFVGAPQHIRKTVRRSMTKDMNLSANHHKRGIEVVNSDEKNGSYKKEKESTENDADNNENLPSRNNNENSSSVDNINITDRFRHYQKVVLAKAQKWGLKHSSIYELLIALPPEISLSRRETASKRLIDGDVFMNSSVSELSRIVALMFNNLYYGIPEVAPSKLSEEEHCDINDVPILNSEFKPLGCTPLQEKMDRLKVQLKARKSINQQLQRKGGPGEAVMFLSIGNSMESFFMDLKCDGLYRSWPFLTTKLVVGRSTIPLAEFAISHLMAFEERVEKIAKILNTEVVNSRPSITVLHTRISGYTTSKNDVQIECIIPIFRLHLN
ncbi:hypothetical protein F8M41_003277 [Gigaspora margarita]|uniref:Uncharacterized protein n=1 Tax=Gigaspora margarita TaxID=4874 RepID=A0A8H3XDZ4_GIGMA|nr:hypothetical protein F8M41_003277 [Gigaspora margarita]